jgi:DNA-binding transcriptional MerR regulator
MATIGEASRRSGVGIETIRYYEREGIVSKPERTPNGRRRYMRDDIACLRFVKRCRELGFSLPDARALLLISQGGNIDCGNVLEFGLAQLAEVRTKIEELRNLEVALEELTSNCKAGSPECPMLDGIRSA